MTSPVSHSLFLMRTKLDFSLKRSVFGVCGTSSGITQFRAKMGSIQILFAVCFLAILCLLASLHGPPRTYFLGVSVRPLGSCRGE